MSFVLIGEIRRFETVPRPLSRHICFEIDELVDWKKLSKFLGKKVKITIENIK